MSSIFINQREFVPYLSDSEIQARIAELAAQINRDYEGKIPMFIVVLSGAFRFASDLMRHITIPCEINFVKLASYRGTERGNIEDQIEFNTILDGRHVILLEDIVDTGHTIEYLMEKGKEHDMASVRIASLLFKPDAYIGDVKIDYCGFEIPNLFVVGYGLDYYGQGRNLNNVYQVKE